MGDKVVMGRPSWYYSEGFCPQRHLKESFASATHSHPRSKEKASTPCGAPGGGVGLPRAVPGPLRRSLGSFHSGWRQGLEHLRFQRILPDCWPPLLRALPPRFGDCMEIQIRERERESREAQCSAWSWPSLKGCIPTCSAAVCLSVFQGDTPQLSPTKFSYGESRRSIVLRGCLNFLWSMEAFFLVLALPLGRSLL